MSVLQKQGAFAGTHVILHMGPTNMRVFKKEPSPTQDLFCVHPRVCSSFFKSLRGWTEACLQEHIQPSAFGVSFLQTQISINSLVL